MRYVCYRVGLLIICVMTCLRKSIPFNLSFEQNKYNTRLI